MTDEKTERFRRIAAACERASREPLDGTEVADDRSILATELGRVLLVLTPEQRERLFGPQVGRPRSHTHD